MNIQKSLAQIKASARGHLTGNYGIAASCAFVFLVISTILQFFSFSFNYMLNTSGFFIVSICTIIISIVQLKLRFGISNFILKLICKKHPGVSDMFQMTSNANSQSTSLAITISFKRMLCAIPFLTALAYTDIRVFQNQLLALALLLVGIIGLILIEIKYSTTFFIINDIPDSTYIQTTLLSKWLIKDNMMKLFWLKLSFVPLLIVGCNIRDHIWL